MAEFDVDAYLNRKLGSPAPDKIDAIMKAKEAKIAGLQQFRDAMAAQDPTRTMREQAIRDGRTGGEFASDVGLSALQGLDSLAKLPAMVYDKATTGDFYGPETQAISAMSDEREKLKSALSQAKTQEKMVVSKEAGDASKAAAEALIGPGVVADTAGVAAEFGTSFWESMTDPASLPEFVAQQVAQMGVMGKVGRGAELAAQAGAKIAPKLAATAAGKAVVSNSATAGAVGFGAGLQGVDTGSDTMQRLMTLPDDVWAQNPEFVQLVQSMEPAAAKQEIASRIAGQATLKAAGASLASSMLPGGNALEKALVGKQKGGYASVVPQAFRGEAVQEGLEEGSGAYIANKGVQEVNPEQGSLEGVGAAAGQGAFLGGVLGGGVSALQVKGVKVAKDAEAKAQRSADFQAAAQTGDTSAYLDPESKSYDPATAVSVLFKNSKLDTATEETKQTNLQKATEIVDSLTTQRDEVATLLSGGVEAQVAVQEQGLKTVQEKIAQTDPADTEQLAKLNDLVSMFNEEIDAVRANTKPANVLQGELDVLDRHIKNSSKVLNDLTLLTQPKIDAAELDNQVALADSTPDATDTKAVEQSRKAVDIVLNMAMSSPDMVPAKVAAQLANNTSNSLSEEQRGFLRAFSEAQVATNALKTLGKVSEEIYAGNPALKMKGIADYRKESATSLAAGNQKAASKSLNLLNAFVEDHTNKAEAAQEAFEASKNGSEWKIVSEGNGQWRAEPGFWLDAKARAVNGGLDIGKNSARIVANIPVEAEALSKVATELTAAFNLKFGTSPTVAPSPVPAAQATASPTPAAPTVSDTVKAASDAVKTTTTNLLGSADKTRIKVSGSVDTGAAGESANVTTLLKMLGVPVAKGTYTELPSEQDLLSAQKRILEIHEEVQKDPAALENYKTELGSLFAQLRQEDGVDDTARAERATKHAKKYGNGNPTAHLMLQLAEELNEFSEEVNRLTGKTSSAADLKLQKKAFKVLRFGENTVIKDAANEHNGKTNGEAFRIAQTQTTPSQEVGVEFASQATSVANDLSVQENAEVEPRPETSSEPTVATETTSTEVDSKTGKLVVLQSKSPEGTPFNKRNLLADYVSQNAGRDGDSSKRPLVAVKDFITSLINKEVKVSDFLQDKDSNLDDKQRSAFLSLVKLYKEWAPVIQRNLVKGYFNKKKNKKKENELFRYQDLMQFLIQGTNETGLDVEENVKVAITYAAISAVVSSVEAGPYNDARTVNRMLGREKDSPVSDEEMALLGDKGMLENLWRNSVGQAAVAALGFKASKDAPADLIPRLESAFGAHIQKLLMDRGILVRSIIPADLVQEFLGGSSKAVTDSKQEAQPWQMLRLAYDENTQLPAKIKEIFEANKGSKGILDKLFSVESSIVYPSFEPVPMTQTRASGVNEGIPANILQAVEEKQKEQNFMSESLWNIVGDEGGISEDTFMEIAGAENIDADVMHLARRKATEAKNNGLLREIQRYKEFVRDYLQPSTNGFETPFFYTYSVKKQQRVHIYTSGFNPQQSKIHRQLTYKESWKVEVPFDNEAKLNAFKLDVAAGLGVNLDNEVAETTLKNFDALFDASLNTSAQGAAKASTFLAAVKVLQKRIYEGATLTEQDQKALIAGVKAGGEKMQSFGVLVEMAHYMQAKETGQTSFTSHLQGEVDGKTNGIVLSQLQYGGASSLEDMKERLRRGGFFFEGDEHEQFNAWKSEGNHDAYQSLTRHIVDLASGLASKRPEVFNAIYAFTKPLEIDGEIVKAGRDLTKNPLTTMMFGSALYSAVDKMADKVIGDVYKRIEEAVAKKDAAELKQVLVNLNTLIVAGKGMPIPTNLGFQKVMETELGKEEIKALKKAFHATLGAAAKEAIKQDYADYLLNRDLFNQSTKLTYDLSNAVISAEREQYIADLIKEGTLAVDSKGAPIQALTKAQEQEFQKRTKGLLPMMHTVGSKRDNKLSNGILLAKTENRLANSSAYESRVQFGTVFSDKGTSSLDTKSMERVTIEPGVGPSSKSIHSLDSAISHDAQQNRQVLNNHDALAGSSIALQDTAKALNEALWNNVTQYSPITEGLDALKRTITSIVGLSVDAESRKLSDKAMDNVAKVLNEFAGGTNTNPEQAVNLLIKQMANAAYEADKLRLDALSQVVSIDQYTKEGGNYKPTNTQREAVQEQRKALTSEVTLEVFQGVDTLVSMLGDKLITKRTLTNKVTGKSVFGDLVTSSIPSDPVFVEAFSKRGSLNPQQLVQLLRSKFADNSVNREILEKVAPLLNDSMVIQYVTPETKASDVLKLPNGPSRGWYVATKEGQQAIYVLSPEFGNSGLTAELLLHELLHAALAETVRNPSKQAKALVAELEALQKEAQAIINSDTALVKFTEAASSVDELVSWGMTNQEFQVKVLSKIRMPSKTQENVFVTGMKAFLDTVTKFLFRTPSKQQQNGVSILFQNASGLLASVAKQQPTTTVNQSMAVDPMDEAIQLTTLDIHEALDNGTTDPAFSDHLRNLLGGIVEKLHGPYGAFKEMIQQNQALSPTDVYTKAKDTGVMPFASEALAAGFSINDQEAFALEQVEATMRAALEDNEGQSSVAYNELSRLYTEAYNRFKKEDFTNRPDDKALFDFAFDLKAGAGNKSDYLSRFAALGLAHQGFNKMLQVDTAIDIRQLGDIKTFGDKLQYVFSKVLNYLNGKLTRTYDGQRADAKLTALVDQLVYIEAKKRRTIASNKTRSDSVTDRLEEGIRIKAEQARAKIGDIAQSDFFQKSNNAFVKAASSIVTVIARDRVEMLMETLSRYRDANFREKQGLIAGLITDVRGLPVLFQELLRASKGNEKNRKFIITEVGKSVMNSFTAENIEEFKKDSNTVTEVFLRTDMAALLDKFSLQGMQAMLTDSKVLASNIATLEQQLGQFKRFQHYFIKASKDLGLYLAKGEVRGQHLMMNAMNIANMSDTAYAGRLTEAEAKVAEGIIDQLVSLRALQYTDSATKAKASRIFDKELNRADKGNGVEMVLRTHKSLQKDSKERLFKGSEALMMKGYTPEIYNPNIDIKVESMDKGRELMDMGYSLGAKVAADPKDIDQEDKFIFVMRDGGLNPRLSGIMSLTGMRSKGTREFLGNRLDRVAFDAKKQAAIRDMFNPDPAYDPNTVKTTYAAPILNALGENSGYRYLMQEKTKNKVLERDNRFDKVLGTMAGGIVDKETTATQNQTAVEALKAQYDAEFAERNVSYVDVGPSSSDAELREIYRLLPDTTKESIKEVWGREGMMVRVDLLDINFGYRKLSLADVFDKDERNSIEDGFVLFTQIALQKYAVFKNMARARKGLPLLDVEKYGKRAAMVVRKNERIWQEIVHEMKDIIVVKTGTVMLGNIASNLSLLFMNGVGISDIIKHHRVAMKAATAYQKDSAELFQLKQQIATGFVQGNDAEVRRQVTRLEDHLVRNPVKPLIDAGLMPTIVEDVAADDDIYSYKSQFVRAADKYTSKLNPTVRSIGEVAYMKHDTKLYRGLSHVTQLSDFVARYTLYQHLTTKRVPMSSAEAIQEASDAFVNYDIPMHRGMQYLDDMGIMMFTKYFMRIQRVLLKLTREHPTRVLGTVLLNNYFDLMPMITESSFLNHVGNNPFGLGAVGFPSTLDEMATVNAGLELFK